MPSEILIAIIIAVPVLIFPLIFIGFENFSGLRVMWKGGRVKEQKPANSRRAVAVKDSTDK